MDEPFQPEPKFVIATSTPVFSSRPCFCDHLLETGIVSNEIPIPAIFQIVSGDAVICTINRAWSCEQTLDQRNCQIIFTNPSIDEGEVTIHECTVDRIFRFRFEFNCASSFGDGIPLPAHHRGSPPQAP